MTTTESTMFHPVGSMPKGMTAEAAQDLVLKEVAECLPFGFGSCETDEKQVDWIVPVIRDFRKNPNFVETRHGDWQTFDDVLNFKLRWGASFTGADLNLDLYDDFGRHWANIRGLLRDHKRSDLPYIQRWSTDFNFAYFAFGKFRTIFRQRRYVRPFLEALKREVQAICDRAVSAPQPDADRPRTPILVQVEFPGELVVLTMSRAKAPAWLRPLVSRLAVGYLAQQVLRNVWAVPAQAATGLHACDGNLNRESVIPPEIAAGVMLVNKILEGWPAAPRWATPSAADRAVPRYVHFPLADANTPPSLREEDYAALAGLRLPPGCAFVAGILHEDLTPDDARMILGWIRRYVPGPVHVSGYCGFGRCTVEATTTMLRTAAEVCRPNTEVIA
jgi:hypothetical protein